MAPALPVVSDHKKIIIGNDVFFYKDKAPFLVAGKSLSGALEYDDAEDKVKCHVCGSWFHSLAGHLIVHGVTAREYKDTFGLPRSAALVAEKVRVHQSAMMSAPARIAHIRKLGHMNKHRKGEPYVRKDFKYGRHSKTLIGKDKSKFPTIQYELNRRRICPPQVIERLRNLAGRLGRTPSRMEIREDGIPVHSLDWYYGGHREAIVLAKLPVREHKVGGWVKHTTAMLLTYLRSFYKIHGRVPRASDLRRGLIPARKTVYTLRFGSWNKALRRAGLTPNQNKCLNATKESLTKAFKEITKFLGHRPSYQEYTRISCGGRYPSMGCFRTVFGSWQAALDVLLKNEGQELNRDRE
jgi:hypothetical protein